MDGAVTTMEQLNDRMEQLMTPEMIQSLSDELAVYAEQDGELYLRAGAGEDGGLLGIDEVYITSAESGDDIVILNMHAHGDGEYWGMDEDTDVNFGITLKRTEDGFRVHYCEPEALMYITWEYMPEYDKF